MKRIAIALCLAAPAALAEFVVVKPFPDSKVSGRDSRGSYTVPEGPIANGRFSKWVEAQGKATRLAYKNPKAQATGGIADWYRKQFKTLGCELVLDCKGSGCGKGQAKDPLLGAVPASSDAVLLSARLDRRELGDVYFTVHITPSETSLVTVEAKATQENQVAAAREAAIAASKVKTSSLKDALEHDGHAPIAGILYKPGEVALRPEAAPAVEEIAKLLREEPELKLYVVGHTDAVGELPHNLALSKKRAQSLVDQLRKQGIPPSRLRPDGVGPFAPVASNLTEQGRSRNRRVELVAE